MKTITFGVAVVLTLVALTASADDSLRRYFDQLRVRHLYGLAESEGISRLANEKLTFSARVEVAIELSRTFAEHAGFVSDEQRAELWERARETVWELAQRESIRPRAILLEAQQAAVFVQEGDWRRAEIEVRQFDDTLRQQAIDACRQAIAQLQSLETAIQNPSSDLISKRNPKEAISSYERRVLQQQIRWNLALAYRNRAELFAAGTMERKSDLSAAEAVLRPLIGGAEEPVQTEAKLLMAVCQRLKGDREHALEAVVALEKMETKPNESIGSEITAEHVQLLLELDRTIEAAKLLLKTRNEQKRLSGRLWFLQVRALIAMRSTAIEKREDVLSGRLNEQIVTTVSRCEDQVGGFWSRRCRQLWDNSQTLQQYGAQLDTLMQQARADYTSRRWQLAIEKYASAETAAVESDRSELAMEIGFTKVSILLEQSEFEQAAREFFRLSVDYPKQAKTSKAHLLGCYCLGRLYDAQKTDTNLDHYRQSLGQHLQLYADDATANDARMMHAQLLEQQHQTSEALAAYLGVDHAHVRFSEAMLGAARCYDMLLIGPNDHIRPREELFAEATERLSVYLGVSNSPNRSWSMNDAEVALHLATILLSCPVNVSAANGSNGQQAQEIQIRKQCEHAERWLDRVDDFLKPAESDAIAGANKSRVAERAHLMMVIALAGQEKFAEADRKLKSHSFAPSQLVSILTRLTPMGMLIPESDRKRLAAFQLKIAAQLNELRGQLSSKDQLDCDLVMIEVNLTVGQRNRALEIAKTLATENAKNRDLQRTLANRLIRFEQPETLTLAKGCWHRTESLTKPGSVDWIQARLGVVQCAVRLKQHEEARKLIRVTKVLYPSLGNPDLKSQFESLELEVQQK